MKNFVFPLVLLFVLLLCTSAYAVTATGVTATETTSGSATPGQTLTYTVVVGATGLDASSVQFSDGISDANLTLVGGSLNATPLPLDDSYTPTIIANTSINTANSSGFSVLGNDFLGYKNGSAVAAAGVTL